ncbi:MAG: nucleotidyltransferase family protein [Myxococcales bacterium]|nr:nucleotidyltransferase family protein [Myxococcales bacterium]
MPLRFAPPTVAPSPELAWVLLRAYGPSAQPSTAGIDGDVAVELARKLDLAARIARRRSAGQLQDELGKSAARHLVADLLASIGHDRVLMSAARELATTAASADVPLVWLKFAALRFLGVLPEGGRNATDLDVLVSTRDALRFHALLVARGFVSSDLPASEHHLPPLHSPRGVPVEVHHRLLGLRPTSRGASLTAEDIIASGAAVRHRGAPENSYLPDRDLLLAHLILHAYVHHGAAPSSYPMTRLFADLADLRAAEGGGAPGGGVRQWLGAEMAADEISAVLELAEVLCRGEAPAALSAASRAGLLLRHVLGGIFVPAYEDSLKLAFLFQSVTDESRLASAAHLLRGAFFPTRAQLELIYGPASSPHALRMRRAMRPFDLLWRLGRYAWSHVRLRAGLTRRSD